jgi:methylglyoxal synthase
MRLPMEAIKRVALIAHDNKKADLVEWVQFNKDLLARHDLYATRTTGRLITEHLGLAVTEFQSGPLGGDQQIGARIADGRLDVLIFFWDPLEPLPHDPDVRALLRIAVVWNIPVACNRATADFLISSPLMVDPYDRLVPAYGSEAPAGDASAARGGNEPNEVVASSATAHV